MDVAQLERLIIFPLPRVVLLPGMPMPLHIFEPRYRAMTRVALEQERYVAMATLDPSGDEDTAQRPRVRPDRSDGTPGGPPGLRVPYGTTPSLGR